MIAYIYAISSVDSLSGWRIVNIQIMILYRGVGNGSAKSLQMARKASREWVCLLGVRTISRQNDYYQSEESHVFLNVDRADRVVLLSIHKMVGHRSRTAGIVLAIFSLVFLGLSLYFSSNIVFQIDSIVCLLAAIALFLRGERSSVQLRIVNRMLESSNQTLDEFSSFTFGNSPNFSYVPMGDRVTDVSVVPNLQIERPATLETSMNGQSAVSALESDLVERNLIPPGRSLAELYLRELNIAISTELLTQSLGTILCERFELASSLSVKQSENEDTIEISLKRPALRHSCSTASHGGIIGCPVSSMFAILFCYASKRIVHLDRCDYNSEKNEMKIILGFVQKS